MKLDSGEGLMTTSYEEFTRIAEGVENIKGLVDITKEGLLLSKVVINGAMLRVEKGKVDKSNVVALSNVELLELVQRLYLSQNLDEEGTLSDEVKDLIFDVRVFDYQNNKLFSVRGSIVDIIAAVVFLRREYDAAKA